jgi:hypothetical protein
MRRIALLLPLLAACVDAPAGPTTPLGAIAFQPPLFYETWWHLTEQCSGISGSLSNVHWYFMPGVSLFPLNGQLVTGFSVVSANQIVLAGDMVNDGPSVRHEMLHQLLGAGITGHPRSQFLGKCGGTVYCSSNCINDGGPVPARDPAAIAIAPADLEVSVEVIPENPSLAKDDGLMVMSVLAANRTGHSAEVVLPSDNIGFSFALSNDKGFAWAAGVPVPAPETTRFAVGEIKRYVFDFRIIPDLSQIHHAPGLPLGTYIFGGAYGGRAASNSPTVTLAP